MNQNHILTEQNDRVLTLRINRPDKKNALSQAMYAALANALGSAATNPEVRVVLITGQSDCFTSGNDIQDFLKAPTTADGSPVARFMRGLARFPKPVVAAVNGPAVGIGTTLLLHCDLVYAGENTRFHMPFVNIGICAEYGSSWLLPRIMGNVRAAELVLLGEVFSAAKALEYGLINEVLPAAEVEARARDRALRLAQQPPDALRINKHLLRRPVLDPIEQAMLAEFEKLGPMLTGPEAREAMTAFIQKRKPDFSRFA
jgi:enoyl-CoA hydratase/carnithine racemase